MGRRLQHVAVLALVFFTAGMNSLSAHPVPRRCHDRVILVRLDADPLTYQLRVQVDYRLEVDTFTAVFDDLQVFSDKVDLAHLKKPQEFYDAFARCYAPILADNLVVKLNDKPLVFTCAKRRYEITDPDKNLRCDFVFQANVPLTGEDRYRLTFREANYSEEAGRIQLSLAKDSVVTLHDKSEPDEALKARLPTDLGPGDDDRLREIRATFSLPSRDRALPPETAPPEVTAETPQAESATSGNSLLDLLLDTETGFWVLMFLAAVLGGAHALTPGHGKTLVAAYLVGERGTTWHALVLGLVTTLTHTGAVLILAAAMRFVFPKAAPADVQMILGLGGGLLITVMGFWLLLRRLAGQADHFHLPGHGHSHSHGPGEAHHHHEGSAGHSHDEHGHDHAHEPRAVPGGWWGLIVLGVSGGIIPCWDAIAIFGSTVSTQRLWLALPLLLAFSAGLASVLIVIGIAVVHAKGLVSSRWETRRVFQLLPILSALLVTCLGLWLCYETLHGRRV